MFHMPNSMLIRKLYYSRSFLVESAHVTCIFRSSLDFLKVIRFSFPVPVVDPSAKVELPLSPSLLPQKHKKYAARTSRS